MTTAVTTNRKRKAFVMAVSPGKAEEYTRRHNPIWPELADALKAHGVSNYSIFYHPSTRQLFGYIEVSNDAAWPALLQTEVCLRWWRHLSDIMPMNENHAPLTASLSEVFHLD